MEDIIDTEEVDKDTVEAKELEEQFSVKYNLIAEKAVSLKKSYISKLSCTKSLKIGVGLSDDSIEVYELSSTSINRICKLSGHKASLTEVVFSPKEENLIYSAGSDGLVKLWDTRSSGSCVQEYKDPEEEILRPYDCMDVSCNGKVICAGSQLVKDDAYLVFFDQRNTKPLGGYWNSHTDDITQVKFHKTKTELLATTAIDGLLNVFNITEQSEDDALLYSLNVENSVDKLNWLDEKTVSCVTQSNDFQLWDVESGDMLRSLDREKISRSIKRSKGDDCYLVDTWKSNKGVPTLLAGSNGGNGDVLRSVSLNDKKLTPMTNFTENKQIVRCCHYNTDLDLLIAAGESGFITAWSGNPEDVPDMSQNSSKITNSLQKLHVNRSKPY